MTIGEMKIAPAAFAGLGGGRPLNPNGDRHVVEPQRLAMVGGSANRAFRFHTQVIDNTALALST